LLASNNLGLLHKTKQFLSQNFEKKDLDETSYVIGIESHIDRKQIILKLSQKAYIEKVLERFRLKNCSTSIAPIIKGDKFNNDQCPRNALEQEQMKNILYAFAVVSLLYAQQSALDLTLQWQLECWVDIKTTQDWNIEKMQRKSSVICKELRTTVWHIDILTIWRWLNIQIQILLKIVDFIAKSIKIFCTNRVAIFFSKNNKSGSKSKQINIKYLRVREYQKKRSIHWVYQYWIDDCGSYD
jgi:hypothetical protein